MVPVGSAARILRDKARRRVQWGRRSDANPDASRRRPRPSRSFTTPPPVRTHKSGGHRYGEGVTKHVFLSHIHEEETLWATTT